MNACILNLPLVEELDLSNLTTYSCGGNENQYSAIICGLPALRKLTLGKVTNNSYVGWGDTKNIIQYCQNLEELHLVGIVDNNALIRPGHCPKLLLIELMNEVGNSFSLSWWSPTLDSSNLAEFQSNFHEYIAKRLATFPESGSHPTLTLSQTVRDAITQQSEDLIVATKHWSLAPARTQV